MKNSIICSNCKTENPFYNFICSNCRIYLRDRVYNIDLWSIIGSIIESPTKAFKTIILSEHKNFISFILLLVVFKHLINVRFISMLSLGDIQSTIGLQFSYLILLGIILTYFLLFSFIYISLSGIFEFYLRFKDTFALLIYSQVPYLFGLIILFTLELVIFGDYLFSKNPTPFTIKSTLSYLFFGLEIASVVWSIFLLFKAFQIQSNQLILSILSSISFNILFWFLIYFCSKFVFTI